MQHLQQKVVAHDLQYYTHSHHMALKTKNKQNKIKL